VHTGELDSFSYNLNIYTPKIAIVDVKSVDSTANVINKVKSNNSDLELILTLLILIVVIVCELSSS